MDALNAFNEFANEAIRSMDGIRDTIDPPITKEEAMTVFNGTIALSEIAARSQCTNTVKGLAAASLRATITVIMAVLTTEQLEDLADTLEQLAYAMDAAARQSPN
jgi:hypothetical protein